MPFEIPTLDQLAERTRQAFRANLKGSDAWLWPNNVGVSAKVMAGAVWEGFGFLDYIARQRFVTTAEGKWLDMHGQQYGIGRISPTFAQGRITLRGTSGTAIPAGLVLRRTDGAEYESTEGGVIAPDGTISVVVQALSTGKVGNARPGTALSLETPLDYLEDEAVVHSDGIGLGADLEGDEAYRQRLLHRLQYPPHGGAPHDYVAWAREVGGVSRVFVERISFGRGTVGVWFLMDDLYADGIPQTSDIEKMREHILAQSPAGADVYVNAPVAVPVDIKIAGLTPDSAQIREAVVAELRDLFRREARVGMNRTDYKLPRSKIWEAISQAAGEDHHTLVSPAESLSFSGGQIPVLGAISFTNTISE